MTAEAERFVTPLTLCVADREAGLHLALGYARAHSAHSRLVREAQVALVAPATANLIAKLAAGIADDSADRRAVSGAHPAVARAGDERGDVRRCGDAGELARLEGARLRGRRSGAWLPRGARTRNRPAGGRGAHSRGTRTCTRALPVTGREPRGDHRGPDARSLRPGAFRQQRLDGRDRHRARARSGAARCRGHACCWAQRCSNRQPASRSCA